MTDIHAAALEPTLARAKATLKSALGEACRANIDRADTGELIRVEEVLAIANEAAKEAVSVRRRLKRDRASSAQPRDAAPVGSRELHDQHGMRWAVFEVHPSASIDRPSVRERFRDGWLAFDSGLETRRVAPIPPAWRDQPDDGLLKLLETAEHVARRAGGSGLSVSP
jgi:hypothetical protein